MFQVDLVDDVGSLILLLRDEPIPHQFLKVEGCNRRAAQIQSPLYLPWTHGRSLCHEELVDPKCSACECKVLLRASTNPQVKSLACERFRIVFVMPVKQ